MCWDSEEKWRCPCPVDSFVWVARLLWVGDWAMANITLHGNGFRPINRLDGHANGMCAACPTPFRHLCPPPPLHLWLGNPLIGQHSPGVDGQCVGWAILRPIAGRGWGAVRGLGCALMPLMLLLTATNMMAVPDPQPLPCPSPPSSPSPVPILFAAHDSLQPEDYPSRMTMVIRLLYCNQDL